MKYSVSQPPVAIAQRYVDRTPHSAALMRRARLVMPGGSTRTHGFYRPYPLVFERGERAYLWDVDGNRYVDYTYNGLSLIHGYSYRAVNDAVAAALPSGSGWVGSSRAQVEFAELLVSRVPAAELVRFTNTGTEAVMLAAKLARRVTGRPLLLKSRGAYHGSYDDLEAGLYGIPELSHRTVLADFPELSSFEAAFALYGSDIAAVVIEPVHLSFEMCVPPESFLRSLADLARSFGALVILDDCLMFRLAPGGSAERFRFSPDITCLGKFIGGGFPVGVVAGSSEILTQLDSLSPDAMYHGGSFNGNPIGVAAGKVSLEHLTRERIASMDGYATRLGEEMRAAARRVGLDVSVHGIGSVLWINVMTPGGEIVDSDADLHLHLAAIERGLFYDPSGQFAMSTAVDDETLELTIAAFTDALEHTAEYATRRGILHAS